MAALLILRIVITQVLRQPIFWLASVGLLAVWWSLEVFMPLGLGTAGIHRSTAHFELALLAGAFGQALALGPCLKLRPMFLERGRWWGLGVDLTALTSMSALMASVVLIPAEAFQRWQFASFEATTSVAALLVGWAHLASMVAIVPLRSSSRDHHDSFRDKLTGVGWIAFAVVVVPALTAGRLPYGRALLHLLDPGRMLRSSFTGDPLGADAWLASLLPIFGWSLVAAGWSRGSTAASIASPNARHALRHPR
ncbi:hypothetical protein Poly30_56640 [Planctomycetes bacterium Poly30]|uniref:Uncharacterized protein n=1 Tax=Saltatorellus ferox TaxID=2528018 RepID=A0A518F181_9BACT|nr:hypothetical protein Poly30_56640 [Planctomycetes bacterium Poly30]